MNFLSILLAPFIICCFTKITDAAQNHEYLTGDISLNCGSTENFTAADGQEWIGDGTKKVSSSIQIKGTSTSSSSASGSTVSADQTQYKTARISRSRFSYAFHLRSGPKLIRLHFNPVPYQGFRSLHDLFTVEAGPFILLGNFSASLTSEALGGDGKSFVKEFSINIEEHQPFNIIFYPDQSGTGTYALINGIEIISVPTHLSYFTGRVQVVGLMPLTQIYNYNHTAFEIIHRQHVKPSDDFVNMFKKRANIPKHQKNKLNDTTWTIAVDVGFRYLVRIHFCELGLRIVKETQLTFEILIDETRVDCDIQPGGKGEDNEFLQHRDYMTTIHGRKHDGKYNLMVSIQLSNELMDRNGPSKGFEILKLSNFDNSLVGPNPKPSGPDTPYPIMQNLLQVCGDQNIIATAAVTIIVILNIFVFRLRQLWENSCVEEGKKPSARARRLCRRFSLAEIEAATQNFNHEFVIGKGGFGKVYKGIIDKGQETVAIKRLKYSSNQGEHEFWTEIETLSELRHVNLVSLIGYCNEQQEMILVYEYMIHGTLGDHLFKQAMGNNNSSSLSWNQCLNICIGAGRGLDYLHTGHGIIHRDVKTSNILLDENFVAKVSDFGLAKPESICESQSPVSTNIKGTHGYFDPYYIRTHKLTRKSDVYAYGVVLLEVLCGRPALDPRLEEDQRNLATWAQENISKGNIEKIISSNIRGEILPNSLKAFVRVAVRCLDDEPKKRLNMAQAVLQLEFALDQQERPNSLVSSMTNTAKGSRWDAFLNSVKSLTKQELEASPSGQNVLLNGRRNSLLQDYTPKVKVDEFDWETIKASTNEFSYSCIIGKGRGGTFYKAVLPTRQVVAVKRSDCAGCGHMNLENEILYLCNYKHPNLMKLLWNSVHGEEQILIYEFMENTSLHTVLFENREQLPWRVYSKIIIGIARGVCYLHQKKSLRILYSNLEPCNIFLDNDTNPKIAIDHCTSKANRVTSTSDYAPPEGYHANQRYVADIYTFGVVILEILSGMKHSPSEQHQDLITLGWKLWDEGRALDLVGASMGDEFASEEATRCIEIALLCTQFLPRYRPDISVVVGALQGGQGLAEELGKAMNRRNSRRLVDP